MASLPSILRHASDVTAILLLGFAYVVLLTFGSIGSYGRRLLDSLKSGGVGAVRRLRGRARRPS